MSLRFLTAGESHGPALTAILEGIPAGLQLDIEMINAELARRQKGYGSGERMQIERDKIEVLSGVMAGKTTGAPLSLLVRNKNHTQWKGKAVEAMTTPRPGHADLTGAIKYGYRDLRPSLERASARETTMRVAIGAVCKQFLAQFDIFIGGYVRVIAGIEAAIKDADYKSAYERAEKNDLRCPDAAAEKKIRAKIQEAIDKGDTLGGLIEVFALNLPPGLGSFIQWDKRLETRLVAALMSVQAIKAVELGDAFKMSGLPGTKAHDNIRLKKGRLTRDSNNAGGIEGGISNGMPVILRAAMKPIATTLTPQQTVDLASGEEVPSKYERSDYCPVPRAVPVLEAMLAFVLSDALIGKLGGDSLAEMKPRFEQLRETKLDDLPMDNHSHTWWE